MKSKKGYTNKIVFHRIEKSKTNKELCLNNYLERKISQRAKQ